MPTVETHGYRDREAVEVLVEGKWEPGIFEMMCLIENMPIVSVDGDEADYVPFEQLRPATRAVDPQAVTDVVEAVRDMGGKYGFSATHDTVDELIDQTLERDKSSLTRAERELVRRELVPS